MWSRNAHVLPLHFGVSSLGTATAILELLGHRTRALNRIGIGAALGETALGAYLEVSDSAGYAEMEGRAATTLARTAASSPVHCRWR